MAPRVLSLSLAVAVAVAVAALLSASSSSAAASAAPFPGIATEFGGAADKQSRDSASLGLLDGACGYGNMSRGDFPAWKAAALPPNSVLLDGGAPANKLGCGICVKVTCDPSRQLPFSPCKAGSLPVTVMVVDSCPTCDKDQINIHASAFQDFLGPIPRVAVSLERVPCEPRSNLVLKVTEARPSSGGFIRVAPQGVAGSGVVSKVEVRPTGSSSSSWTQATNAYGASWQASKFGDGVSSLDVRVTGEPGTAPVEAVGAIYPVAKGRYGTAVQVNGGAGVSASNSSSAAAPAPAAPAPAPAAPAPAPAVAAPAPAPAKAVEAPAPAAPAPVVAKAEAPAAPAPAKAKEAEAPAPPPPAKKETPPPPPPPPPAPQKEEVEEVPAGAESLRVKGDNIGGAGSSVAADILRSAGLAATAGRR